MRCLVLIYGSIECCIVQDVSKQKISTPVLPVCLAEHLQILKKCALFASLKSLVTIIHLTRALLDGANRIVPRSTLLSGVNIMKVTKAVFFIKLYVCLIFFAIDNLLILLLSILPLFIRGKLGTSKIDCGDKI